MLLVFSIHANNTPAHFLGGDAAGPVKKVLVWDSGPYWRTSTVRSGALVGLAGEEEGKEGIGEERGAVDDNRVEHREREEA